MDLSHLGIAVSELSLQRRIQTWLDIQTETGTIPRLMLDQEAPFRVGDRFVGMNLAHFHQALADYRRAIIENPRTTGLRHGNFSVGGMYTTGHLNEALIKAVEITGEYVRATSFGLDEPVDEVAFELSDDQPTQRVTIRSWGVFSATAMTPTGRIELRVDYPDDMTRNCGKRPIDEIDTFLTAAVTWCLTNHRQNHHDLKTGQELFRRDYPDVEDVSELWREVSFSGENYAPVSGYRFTDSKLKLIAYDNHLPGEVDLSPVMREFRRRLLELLPHLAD